MSESQKYLTPPIRSIAAEASSTIKIKINSNSSEQLSNNYSSRTSRLSYSSSSTDSLTSSPVHNDEDDDLTSNDESNADWIQLHDRLHTLRQLIPHDSLSSLSDIPIETLSLAECQVCLNELPIRPLSCCLSCVCSSCIYSHLSTHIKEAQIRISCPSCTHIFNREEILLLLEDKDQNGEISERYKRFYADINREPHIKTCPKCCAIKEVDKNLFEGIRKKKTIPRHVICNECQFEWCFYCHAPWHDKMTCKDFQEGEKLLRTWASQKNNNQLNAQRCPRCKVFISRNGGCPHMICSRCHCDFCYNCGKKRLGLKILGSHDSRFSPFGCKYNLYPDRPILRHTVRGLVAGAATLAAPVAAVGAVALLAVGTTIGAPTYGTYRLVKHIRNKRRARHLRSQSTPSVINEDDDYALAIAASLESYKEETEKRGEQLKSHNDESDDDDDSFDD